MMSESVKLTEAQRRCLRAIDAEDVGAYKPWRIPSTAKLEFTSGSGFLQSTIASLVDRGFAKVGEKIDTATWAVVLTFRGREALAASPRCENNSEESTMSNVIEGHEVSLNIEEGKRQLMVRQEAIEVLRGEANRQADEWLRQVTGEWDELDVSDLDAVKDFQYKLGMACDAVDALMRLAPVPLGDDDE